MTKRIKSDRAAEKKEIYEQTIELQIYYEHSQEDNEDYTDIMKLFDEILNLMQEQR